MFGRGLQAVQLEELGDVVRPVAVLAGADLRTREEVPAPRPGRHFPGIVVVAQDVEGRTFRPYPGEIFLLGDAHVRAPDRYRATSTSGQGQGVYVTLDQQDVARDLAQDE